MDNNRIQSAWKANPTDSFPFRISRGIGFSSKETVCDESLGCVFNESTGDVFSLRTESEDNSNSVINVWLLPHLFIDKKNRYIPGVC